MVIKNIYCLIFIQYTVDSHTGDILVAITGDKPIIGDAIGPSGSRPYTEHIVSEKKEMAVSDPF